MLLPSTTDVARASDIPRSLQQRRVPGPGSRVPQLKSRVPQLGSRLRTGFTLLEVIAAIAILGLAFVVLLKAMGASMALTQKSVERTQATLWAQSLLDSRFAMHPPTPGVTRGRFDKRYSWTLDVRPWQPPPTSARAPQTDATDTDAGGAADLRLYKLDLSVMWGPQARRQTAHFVTLRAAYASNTGGSEP